MSGVLLHGKSEIVDHETLRAVPTPPATATWSPIPHHELLDRVVLELQAHGLQIADQTLALSNAKGGTRGDRMFGLLDIMGDGNSDHSLTVGLRNSHDKILPASICAGSRVFVCDNLAFSAEVVIARKHTRFLHRDLPELIRHAVSQLGHLHERQSNRIATYRQTILTDLRFHDLCIHATDAGVVSASKLPRVLAEFREPQHVEFRPRNLWSAFNAFTEVLKQYDPQELPRRSRALHGLCDELVGTLPPPMLLN